MTRDHTGSVQGPDLEQIAVIRTGMTPLYHSIGHVIRSKIESGEWQIGEQIPSERALMVMLSVSRATIRQGIENLVKEGILYRIHGKGTFVAPPKVGQSVLQLLDFSETMRRRGFSPSAQLLGKSLVEPPPHVRRTLMLAPAEKAVWFQRVLYVNNAPILLETSYFSAARFPDLLDSYDGSKEPHRFVYERCGVQITHEREVFEPVIMESEEANLLGIKGGFPGLWVEHIAYDITSTPVAFLTSLMRGDRCRFYTDLTLGAESDQRASESLLIRSPHSYK